MPQKQCSIPYCERRFFGRGFCQAHYQRWRAHGDPLAGRRPNGQGLDERLWPYIQCNIITRCWDWVGKRDQHGYGWIGIAGRTLGVYRVVYELLIGPIPEGLEPDHLCRNHACCNPDHLEPVTHRANLLRGVGPPALHALKTCCPQGHLYTGHNIRGERICHACINERERERLASDPPYRERANAGRKLRHQNQKARTYGH